MSPYDSFDMIHCMQINFKALQAVHQLLNYVAYVRTGDSLGFLDIFQKLAHFFDHRSNKGKFLKIQK